MARDNEPQAPHGLTDSSNGRRRFLKLTGGALTAGSVGVAGCISTGGSSNGGNIDYPTNDIELTVPYATGGGFDAYARLLSPYWEKELDGTMNVKNVTGGGGVVGATEVYSSNPDGHRILIWDVFDGTVPQIGRDVGYDLREMSHIGYVTQAPNALNLSTSLGIDNWNQFVDQISELNFGTQGKGSISHIGMVLLAEMTGAFSADDLNFVHYGGTGEVLSGLERGEVDAFMPGTATSAVKVVKSLDVEMFVVFSEPSVIQDYMKENNVDVVHWSSKLNVDKIDEYASMTVFRRFLTGPPEVPDEVLKVQRESFKKVINNDKFLTETRNAARPLVDPKAGAEPVTKVIENGFEAFRSGPIKKAIKDAFSG